MDDSSDILGGQLRVARNDSVLALPDFSFTRLFVAASIAIVFSYGLTLLLPFYRTYQEKRYRKAIRRRHGIPDNDHRPFNVAYAAAKRSEKDPEPEDKGPMRRGRAPLVPQAAIRVVQQRNGETAPGIRQRQPATIDHADRQADVVDILPGSHPAYSHSRRASDHTTTASESDFYIPGSSQDNQNSDNLTSNVSASSLYAPAFARSVPHGAQADDEEIPDTVHGKHAREEDGMDVDNEQEAKKSRMDGGFWVADSDDQVEAQGLEEETGNTMDVDEASPIQPKRGAKRMASVDEDEGFESGRAGGREKRARKVSSRESVLRATRGKKRDRAEAGSTFGGDDMAAEDEEDQHRSHRRRRVVSTKKPASNIRGRKRGREIDSPDSADDSDSPSKRAVRQKRGKRNPRADEWTSSDDGMVSTDPLCKGRRIGEEWQTNGHKFKVGPNGQRLRQALVKKPRSRFPMPKDSEHPDRDVNIEVFVETWLSEEEYQLAKERRELAWQSPQSTAIELPTVVLNEVPESPSKGKSLLWASVAGKELPRVVSRPSLVASTSARLNPFQQSPSLPARRISILSAAPTPPETPTKLQRSRTYSKWEKQDLEAAAMTKLREKTKLDSEPEKKPLVASASAPTFSFPSSSSSAAPGATKPAETSNKPVEASATEKISSAPKPSSSIFGTQPSVPVTKASTSDLPSLTIPNSAPKATLPAKPLAVPFPSSGTSTAPAEQPKPSTPASGLFSFGTPAAAVTTSSTSTPDFFAKPATTTAPAPSSTSAPFTGLFGASGQPNPQATKSIFNFAPLTTNTAGVDNSKKAEEKPAQPPGGSLLSRLGPPPSNPAPPTAPASQSNSSFGSFAKPVAPASTPASTIASSTQPAPPLKFKFGVGSATAATAPAASSSGTSQSTLAADASKPTSVFGFPTTSAAPTDESKPIFGYHMPPASGTQPIGGTAPTSSFFGSKDTSSSSAQGTSNIFGGAGTSSIFGAPSAAKDATSAPKSVFAPSTLPTTPPNNSTGSVFGKATTTPAGTPATGSVFGTTTPAGTPSSNSLFGAVTPTPASSAFGTTTPLGTPSSGSVFGTTTPAGTPSANPFAPAATTTPAGAPPKSVFTLDPATPKPIAAPIFGQPSTAETSAPTAPKSVFTITPTATGDSKSSDAASGSTTITQPKFSFNIPGATSNPFTSAAAGGKSVFGSAPASGASSSPFGGASTSGASSSPFGSAPTSGVNPSPFGASSGLFGGAASSGASGSSEQKPTPSMFGFPAAPSGSSSATPTSFSWPKPAEQK